MPQPPPAHNRAFTPTFPGQGRSDPGQDRSDRPGAPSWPVPEPGRRPPPLPPVPHGWQVRLRVLAWRTRWWSAAALLALAGAAALPVLAPAPTGSATLTVTSHELQAGATLTERDLMTVAVPEGAVPDQADLSPTQLLGGTLAVTVPARTPLVPGVLAGGLRGPDGTVVAVVRLADAALVALLHPGDRLDVLGSDGLGGDGAVLAHRALVLPQPSSPSAEVGTLGCGSDPSATVVLAVLPDEVAGLSGAAASGGLTAVVVP